MQKRSHRRTCFAVLITLIILVGSAATAEEGATRNDGTGRGWSKTFELRDYLDLFDFPEQLISYKVALPDGQVKAEDLVLQTEAGSRVPHQLSNVKEDGRGYLRRARVHLRTDLPRGAEHRFTLREESGATEVFEAVTVRNIDAATAEIAGSRQRLRVPRGWRNDSSGGIHPSKVPAPILAVAGEGGRWIGEGSFEAPEGARVEAVQTCVLERGPLFLAYEIDYAFNGGRRYRVVLTVRQNAPLVTVDEHLQGFKREDDVRLRFSYLEGLDPEGRLNMGNGGYNRDGRAARSGAYDADLGEDGRLPTHLTVYAVNSLGANRAQAFWRDDTESALLFCVYRAPDWRTSERYVWNMKDKPENLYFYGRDGDKFMQTRLVGEQRHWALSVIPREELVIDQPNTRESVKVTMATDFSEAQGAGPEVRLWQRLTDLSLDRIKNLIFEWNESVDTKLSIPALMHRDPYREPWDYEAYVSQFKGAFDRVVDRYWDQSGDLGGNHFGWEQERSLPEYSFAREHWTPEQRQRIRSLLVLLPHFQDMDSAMPHRSMMSGHPNFVGAMKQSYGLAAGVFPNHPHAKHWKQAYCSFWDEYLDVYVRKSNPEVNALGGRWMENVTCYNFASLEAAGNAMYGLHAYDGTWLFDKPQAEAWLNWNMHVLMPFYQGRYRITPPQGAHARIHEVEPGGRWHENLLDIAHLAAEEGSHVGAELLWSLTDGSSRGPEGTKPELESQVFNDYGVVMHYDYGGPDEAYLNIQELHGNGYRWHTRANGSLYYAAKGEHLSWNAMETAGDDYDHSRLPLFNLEGKSIGSRSEQNVLQNFDWAQYYLAQGDNPDYTGRGVMMIRDDFIVVYDHVTEDKKGEFQWINETNGISVAYFSDPDFRNEVAGRIDDRRFPIANNWGEGTPHPDVEGDDFSVRWTGLFTPPHAEEVTLSFLSRGSREPVGENDRARLWLDDELILDTSDRDTVTIELEEREHDFRVEYSHRGGDDAQVHLTQEGEQTHYDPIWSRYFVHYGEMPEVYAVKDGAGDNLHLVSAERQRVTSKDWGAVVNGDSYVLYQPERRRVQEGGLRFDGRVGYARDGELALFEGRSLGFGAFMIELTGGDFGASAKLVDGEVEGRFAGREGGTVRVTLPAELGRPDRVTVGGEPVDHRLADGAVEFDVAVSARDGYRTFAIE